MANSQAKLFFILKALLLLCLSSSPSAHADSSWQKESSRYLEQLLKINPDQLQELKKPEVLEFYRHRKYKPMWSNEKGRLDRAYDLLHVIIRAKDEGLEPDDYYLEDFYKYWGSTGLGESVKLDLLLSAALYRYSNDVYTGRLDASDLDPDWHIKRESPDVRRLFLDVARKESIAKLLKQLPPQHDGYQSLKQQLQQFRELEQQGGWDRMGWGPVLERGVQHEQVVLLRRRLKLTGDLVVDPFPDMDMYDRRLEEAVRNYQQRHGLGVDGKVGPQTRRSLNVSVGERISQIRINMERWRWLPRELGERHIRIDLAGFRLQVYDRDTVPLSMRVIVGRSNRKTPSFSSQMYHLMFNPYWNVPDNIAFEDMLPKIRRDPTYLARNQIRVIKGYGEKEQELDYQSIDWSLYTETVQLPFRFRQDPGAINSMGRIKFMLPNSFEINLHDTPNKHLFNRSMRAYSSGCIRVEEPIALAEYVMGDEWQQADIHKVIASKKNKVHHLPEPIPVHVLYQTAWVDQDNIIHFQRDVYERDERLLAALRKISKPIASETENDTENDLKASGYRQSRADPS